MANALDYVTWRGDLSFETSPINEIDLFLLTQITMPNYEDIVKADKIEMSLNRVATKYFKNHDLNATSLGLLQANDVLPALKAMSEQPRFKDILFSAHFNRVSNQEEEQFSATVFRLTPKVIVVAYRGTDDTIIGWKEDCNIAIYDEVPAQRDALNYLEWVADNYTEKIIVVGHSKGGNIGVYAAAKASKKIQSRIIRVINYDGPGFKKEFLREEGYLAVKDKITTILSQNSIIGVLLNTAGTPVYVKANVAGLLAHDGFQWEALPNHFVREKKLSKFSKEFDKAISNTLDKMSDEEKSEFVNELFDILFSSGADTLIGFRETDLVTRLYTLRKLGTNKKVLEFAKTLTKALVQK